MTNDTGNLNVILGHDWLNGMRGGERVLEVICRCYPSAPVVTLFYESSKISDIIKGHKIEASWLNRLPGAHVNHRVFLPLFPGAAESMSLPPADLFVSTSHCVAKGFVPAEGCKHLCYCFTPMRYAWGFYSEYFGGNPFKKALLQPVLKKMREWDKRTCDRVDRFVTLSNYVKDRISRFYGRDADVVYPPVAVHKWTPASSFDSLMQGRDLGKFDLVVSAMVPYKRIDLAVRAYNRLGYPLKIVGTGPLLKKLRSFAGPNIEFAGWLDDSGILELYQKCRALIFPGEEDFGIVPVEVQACGKPVIAFGKGGALETVVDGVTGVFFEEQTEDSLLGAVESMSAKNWDITAIRANAERFSEENFIKGLSSSIETCMLGKKEGNIVADVL